MFRPVYLSSFVHFRGFRAWRLLILQNILTEQARGNPQLKIKPEALLLTAACVWLMNGLHARPDDGPSSRCLMMAVLPVTEYEGDDDQSLMFCSHGQEDGEDDDGSDWPSLPYNPYGAVFLRCIKLVQVPRMRVGGPCLSPKVFKHLFGKSEDAIGHQYNRVGILSREEYLERRVANRSMRTATYIPEPGTPPPVLFRLQELHFKLPPPIVDGGSDVEDEEETGGQAFNIDEEITQLYRQFLIDVMQKVPSPKGMDKTPYCILDLTARLRATEDVYNNPRLPELWNACQYKRADETLYKMAFEHLFPPQGHLTSPKVQNYLQSQYYRKWKDICARYDPLLVQTIRHDIRRRVFRLAWIPHACQDRIWATKHLNGFKQYPPTADMDDSAPRILIRKNPEW
jgi:hypothetical protein